jgi:hypothetical protein
LDFFRVCTKEPRKEGNPLEVYPDFIVGRSKDLMVRGQTFYAIWNEEKGLWSTDEYDVTAIVDRAILKKADELKSQGIQCTVKLLSSNSTNGWNSYKKYIKNAVDNSVQLDMKLTFANTEVKKSDYVSRRLPYSLALGDYSAWDELVGTLYNPEEREKIEWAIGAVISGDAKKIEKFLVFYGPGGTGKSTIMKIIQKLFPGYIAMFEAKALVGNNNAFATEAFKSNPLVAIQHDGDLSKIEDNSTLNSVVGHDTMRINEKYKSGYEMELSAMLFMGTNKPVKITDAKSGLIRRLIDVEPSLRTFEYEHYQKLMKQIDFELGAIAQHCLDVYKKLGKSKYSNYRPTRMMLETDPFHNYIDEHFDIFRVQDGTSLKQAWELYKAWGDEVKLGYSLKQYQFREKLKDYFEEFHERIEWNGSLTRRVYKKFIAQQFAEPIKADEKSVSRLVMDQPDSILDEMYAGMPAQLAGSAGTPPKYWDKSERISKKTGEPFIPTDDQVCSTVLGEIDTSQLHYVKLPEHHIWIDFDLTDEDGNKSLEKNLEAAASWKPTYAEISKSGTGVHLHYIYDGDTSELAPEYAPGIEIKTCNGLGSLRRKLTRCNNVSVATISSGLPFREKKMQEPATLKTEKGLRNLIGKALRKEVGNGATKPSIDFIKHVLKEAHRSGIIYDVEDLRSKILAFAVNSTNNRDYCVKMVTQMDFKSAENSEEAQPERTQTTEGRIVFFDCEVYKNLFVICWKFQGSDKVIKMINPTPMEVEKLLYEFKLVGFNNRSYDNHIMYARYLGATNEELYRLSQRIMDKDDTAKYGEAWNLSYADVYDFSSDKKSLKKWEIELGIKHMEMDIPWDQPVPEDRILDVVNYCANDVIALEAVFDACKADFIARQTLADMSGLTVNQSTRQHVMRILFGNEKNPQKQFVYTDLSEQFPGYEFNEFAKTDKSKYRGFVVGEGGFVYAEPGMHRNVALLDVASMHPTSLIELNLFGPYTEKFQRILEARLAIKHGDLKKANELIPGIEVTEENAKALANSLKLVANSTYGYTCAKFPNPARDPRNKDNIVAKRGALFMIDLLLAVQEQGFQVVHIKTDSIKIADATPDIIAFVQEFGAKYGYTFEHEATYEKMCLVNDAVYIAKTEDGKWTATGAEFKHPYVFKRLFSHEPITFRDLCETKQVKKGAMYLRFAEGDIRIGDMKDDTLPEDELVAADPAYGIPDAPDAHIGRSGLFVPINPDQDIYKGGHLIVVNGDKVGAVQGTKGYLWAEAEMIRTLQDGAIERMVFEPVDEAVQGTGSIADVIDMSYYTQLAEDAYQSIAEFGDAEEFIA